MGYGFSKLRAYSVLIWIFTESSCEFLMVHLTFFRGMSMYVSLLLPTFAYDSLKMKSLIFVYTEFCCLDRYTEFSSPCFDKILKYGAEFSCPGIMNFILFFHAIIWNCTKYFTLPVQVI